jgi:hypothetical protein
VGQPVCADVLTCCAGHVLQAGSQAAGGSLSCADPRVNPVQSVSNSGFFSAAGDGDEEGGSWPTGEEDSRLGGLGSSMESSYASALQVNTADRAGHSLA